MNMKSNSLLLVMSAAFCLFIVACGKKEEANQASTTAESTTAAAEPPATPAKAPETSDFNKRTQAIVRQLETELGATKTAAFTAALAEPNESPHAALGVPAFLSRNLELTAWLYGKGVIAQPDNPVYLNNFGVLLHEKALSMQPKKQAGAGGGGSVGGPAAAPAPPTAADYLALSKESFEKALALKNDNAAFHGNLGFVLLDIWRSNANEAILQAAVDELRKAVTLNPKSAAAWAHLAEALAAQKDTAGAADALEKSRGLGAFNGALISAGLRMPPEVMDGFKKKFPPCKVDFGCKANCPRSIIGQINFVTCEMEQSSAQMACEAGMPYAAGFDCSEQVPEFGILIPGLNSGFSLITPWGRLDMTVDGKGGVNYKFKAGANVGAVGGELTAQGSWSPSSGFSSVEVKPGVNFNLVGGEAAEMLDKAKMGPVTIVVEGSSKTGETELKLEAYGGSVFTH